MVQHVYDEQGTAWVDGGPGTYTSAFTLGNAFSASTGGWVTGLRWYRVNTGAAYKPDRLRLYDAVTQQLVAEITSVPDNGAVGWQDATLVTPKPLVAGRVYVVCVDVHNGSIGAYIASGNRHAPDYPFAFDTLPVRSTAAGTTGYPGSASANFDAPVDIIWQQDEPTPPPATPGDVSNQLAAWLSTTDGTHADSAPLQDHTTLTTVASQVGATNTKATGATGFDAIKAVADAIASAVGGLPGTIASAVTTITGQLTALTGNTAQTGLATIGAISHDLGIVDGKVIDLFAGLAGGATGALSGRTAFPTALWTLADEVDFTTDLAWNVAADLYVLTITTPPPTVATDHFAGVNWYHRLGSWAPLNGSQIAGPRGFVEFSPQQLHQNGQRMPGLALRCRQATLGHVQAWLLT